MNHFHFKSQKIKKFATLVSELTIMSSDSDSVDQVI